MHSSVLCSSISDHFPVLMLIEDTGKGVCDEPPFTIQNITPFTLDAFLASIANVKWDDVYHSENLDTAYESFISIFKHIFKQHFNEKIVRIKGKNRKPWITKGYLKIIKKKTKFFKKFLRTKFLSDLANCKRYRNKVTALLKHEKRRFLHDQFEACEGSSEVWNKLNRLFNHASTVSSVTEFTKGTTYKGQN